MHRDSTNRARLHHSNVARVPELSGLQELCGFCSGAVTWVNLSCWGYSAFRCCLSTPRWVRRGQNSWSHHGESASSSPPQWCHPPHSSRISCSISQWYLSLFFCCWLELSRERLLDFSSSYPSIALRTTFRPIWNLHRWFSGRVSCHILHSQFSLRRSSFWIAKQGHLI